MVALIVVLVWGGWYIHSAQVALDEQHAIAKAWSENLRSQGELTLDLRKFSQFPKSK
jgi:hypothetical protein